MYETNLSKRSEDISKQLEKDWGKDCICSEKTAVDECLMGNGASEKRNTRRRVQTSLSYITPLQRYPGLRVLQTQLDGRCSCVIRVGRRSDVQAGGDGMKLITAH